MKELVEKILNEKTEGTHLFLVDIRVQKNRIDVSVDGDSGVNINECAALSRHLHHRLEEMSYDTGNYIVEISSPGFDRDVNEIRSLKKNTGRKLQIRNSQNKFIKGRLAYVDENGIILVQPGKAAKNAIIRFNEIKEAKVII